MPGLAKVFTINLTGGGTVQKELDGIQKKMASIGAEAAKTKTQLAGLSGSVDTKGITALNEKLAQQETTLKSLAQTRKVTEQDLSAQINLSGDLANATGTAANQFATLNKQYKESLATTRELALQHGVESEQALKAAAATAQYKQQLLEIKTLVNSGGATPVAAAAVPFTTNLADLEKEQAAVLATGTAVNDLEKDQIQATIEANEWAASQKTATESVKQTAAAVPGLKLRYDEFSSTLRNNIEAQIENEQALIANRAAQKELSTVLSESGASSGAAFDQLAALRQEELLLVESNKALSVTVRNQAKEFISAGGSVDEMQAQLNQLQQTFEQLSEEERASPFGQSLKAEIDVLEPKVKSFEAEIGKFSRNVGNYPKGYQDAFSVLNKELDNTKAKIVQGNFAGKALDELTAKEKILADATATLGKNYSTSAQQSNAFKEATRQIGLSFGTGSQVFKDFTAQVKAGNVELKNTDKTINATTGSGGAFSKLYSGIRQLANIIPGIGISGIVLLLLTPLSALASKLFETARGAAAGGKANADLQKSYEDMTKAVEGASNEFVSAVTNVETLKINIKLAKDGILDKTEVLKQYNDTIGKTTGQVKSLDEAEAALIRNGDAYIQMTLLKAAANFALEAAAKKAFEAEQDRRKKDSDFAKAVVDTRVGSGSLGLGGGSFNASEFDAETKRVAAAQKKRKDEQVKLAEDDKNALVDIAKSFQTQAAQIAKDMGFDFFGGTETGKPKKSKITVDEAEELKNIEANRLRLLAIENTSVNEIEKIRKLSFDEEEQHLRNVEKINVDAYNAKIALFQKNKNQNAEEKKELAEFGEQKSAIQLETSRKIQEIEKKRFDEQAKQLEEEANLQVAEIKAANDRVQNDPTLTNLQKAQAFVDADNQILAIQQDFYNKLSKLNADFNKDALLKARAGIVNIMKELQKEVRALGPATLKDIQDTGAKAVTEVQTALANSIIKVLESNLSPTEIATKITALQNAANRLILANQVAADKIALDQQKDLLDKKLINEKDYLEALAKYKKDQAALDQTQLVDAQTSSIDKLGLAVKELGATFLQGIFHIHKYTDAEKAAGKDIADLAKGFEDDVVNAANIAYATYWQSQANHIEQQKVAQEEYIERERQRVLATAQSQSEIDTINRKYDQKKKDADKQAANQKKQLALKQASIDFALAAIKTYASFGWPLGLIAVAGLAIAYAAQRAAINAQQFAKGGQVKGLGAGRISGPSNISAQRNGDNMLATVRTGEVILNDRHQAALGGPRTFAAIGVPGFAGSGQLGTSLRAPVFSATTSNISQSASEASARMDRLEVITEDVLNAVYFTDNKPVTLVPKAVTRAQSRTRKDVSIATI